MRVILHSSNDDPDETYFALFTKRELETGEFVRWYYGDEYSREHYQPPWILGENAENAVNAEPLADAAAESQLRALLGANMAFVAPWAAEKDHGPGYVDLNVERPPQVCDSP